MGSQTHYTAKTVTLRPQQKMRLSASNITRIVTGGFEKITYKEVKGGITFIRTKWKQKKNKERRKRS